MYVDSVDVLMLRSRLVGVAVVREADCLIGCHGCSVHSVCRGVDCSLSGCKGYFDRTPRARYVIPGELLVVEMLQVWQLTLSVQGG